MRSDLDGEGHIAQEASNHRDVRSGFGNGDNGQGWGRWLGGERIQNVLLLEVDAHPLFGLEDGGEENVRLVHHRENSWCIQRVIAAAR